MPQTPATPDDVVAVEDLRVAYGFTVAVDGVSLRVGRGEIFGILGPNGAGKTTTVECIAGLRTPDAGRVTVLGRDALGGDATLREHVGVQLQSGGLPDKLRVAEALDLFAAFYADPADPAELLELLHLTDKRDTRFSALSGGQRQRLSIALALVGSPEVAILDELTTGLDPAARRDTWSLIESVRDRGVTIVLVTHFMEEAERLCDRVAVLHHGRVIAVDHPAALASGVGARQTISFATPAARPDLEALRALPEVREVRRQGERVTISGSGDLVAAVIGALVAQGVVPHGTRIIQSTLDDAFVALTGDESDTAGTSGTSDTGDGAHGPELQEAR